MIKWDLDADSSLALKHCVQSSININPATRIKGLVQEKDRMKRQEIKCKRMKTNMKQ